ncbi:MAG TPA: hypothetical protein PKD09_09245 [Aggregatilinea sp.]|uniref:hypothetical protein n=1 Tax=Aggregatilinea sp. TaxID=2806333 RepID=UPI002C62C891|nr:hypothetical protein [Aggregatilinea sp.]HML21821.1 hypothetical protein [Aggregatilinea sp.]
MAKKKRSKHDHVPAYSAAELVMAAEIVSQSNLPVRVQLQTLGILVEASTPDRHNLKRAPGEQGANMRQTQKVVKAHGRSALNRAFAELDSIPDSEWERLLDEAEETASD